MSIVGYQGYPGSWSERAAAELWRRNFSAVFSDEPEYLPLISSVECVRSLQLGYVDFAVVAIFNSIGGVVDETAVALEGKTFLIRDSISLHITHDCYTDDSLTNSRRILGHPQVLKQCTAWIDFNYPKLERIPVDDGLRYLHEDIHPGDLVIAPPLASLPERIVRLQADVQNPETNQTLFLLLSQ